MKLAQDIKVIRQNMMKIRNYCFSFSIHYVADGKLRVRELSTCGPNHDYFCNICEGLKDFPQVKIFIQYLQEWMVSLQRYCCRILELKEPLMKCQKFQQGNTNKNMMFVVKWSITLSKLKLVYHVTS